MASGNQWLRKVGLIVGNSGTILDLSQLEIEFTVKAGDFEAPNTAIIRLFNPQASTIHSIQTEYTQVSLQAGYQQGNYGIIFSGTIMQVKTGKLDNTTRYLDILAADADVFHSFGFINKITAPNQSAAAHIDNIAQSATANGVQVSPDAKKALASVGGVLPRGKVSFGFAAGSFSDAAARAGCTWWIENGVLKAMPLTGYLPGEAVVINSTTGQIGVPEATEQGVNVRTLLNPLIKIGNTIKLNNDEITATQANNFSSGYPTYKSKAFFANLDPQGIYTVMVVEHNGGIRKNPWYTDIIALAIDQSSGKVRAYG
jgi:hypothetical protein